MNKYFQLIYLILILTLNFSCIEKKTPEAELNRSFLTHLSKSDTFRFSTGTRSIFQDSKENYWIGSHGQGVCLFDGTSFEYFSTHEGLSGNQIRSIQEDKNGNIWFGTGSGVSSYDGKVIKRYVATDYSTNLKMDLESAGNYLWFNAGMRSGVYLFDGEDVKYLALPIPAYSGDVDPRIPEQADPLVPAS